MNVEVQRSVSRFIIMYQPLHVSATAVGEALLHHTGITSQNESFWPYRLRLAPRLHPAREATALVELSPELFYATIELHGADRTEAWIWGAELKHPGALGALDFSLLIRHFPVSDEVSVALVFDTHRVFLARYTFTPDTAAAKQVIQRMTRVSSERFSPAIQRTVQGVFRLLLFHRRYVRQFPVGHVPPVPPYGAYRPIAGSPDVAEEQASHSSVARPRLTLLAHSEHDLSQVLAHSGLVLESQPGHWPLEVKGVPTGPHELALGLVMTPESFDVSIQLPVTDQMVSFDRLYRAGARVSSAYEEFEMNRESVLGAETTLRYHTRDDTIWLSCETNLWFAHTVAKDFEKVVLQLSTLVHHIFTPETAETLTHLLDLLRTYRQLAQSTQMSGTTHPFFVSDKPPPLEPSTPTTSADDEYLDLGRYASFDDLRQY